MAAVAEEEDVVIDPTSSSETDSAIGDLDTQSGTTSLRSSILDYVYENGRTYHAYHAGAYWGPNDERAQEHLDIGHHVFKILLHGELFLAPIPKHPRRVLDVGTGTGIWAIDFADAYPSASVIGTDLSPIQPKFVPPNLQFEVDDCCDEWTYAKESFDFIHVRGLYGCVADWDSFCQQVMDHLQPGGYFEQVEQSVVVYSDDGTVDGTALEEWGIVSLQAGDAFGKTLRICDEAKDNMIKAGFEDVTEHKLKVPLGPWPREHHFKELGRYNRLQWEEGLEAWTMMLLTKILKWQVVEVQVYLSRVRKALRDSSIHGYQRTTVVYGRKPMKRDPDAE